MKIVERKISELIFAEYNPRQLTTDQYEHLKSSMLRFGCVDPVIVNMYKDRKNIIIGGHQRCKVWKDLKHDTIPCVEIELELDRERELSIRLNRNLGDWNWDDLANNFDVDELVDWGFTKDQFFDGPDEEEAEEEKPAPKGYTPVTCPSCGHEFKIGLKAKNDVGKPGVN